MPFRDPTTVPSKGCLLATRQRCRNAVDYEAVCGSTLVVCDKDGPAEPRCVNAHASGVQPVAFSSDGRFVVSASEDRFARVCNTATGEERYAVDLRRSSIEDSNTKKRFALSADGGKLAIIYGVLSVVDLETGRRVEMLGDPAVNADFFQIAFSPDGALLAVSRFDGSASLVDCATGQTLHTMRAPRAVGPFAFSQNGRTLAAGIDNGLVILWHVATGQELTTFSTEPGPVTSLRFSADGRSVGAAIINDDKAALYVWSSHGP